MACGQVAGDGTPRDAASGAPGDARSDATRDGGGPGRSDGAAPDARDAAHTADAGRDGAPTGAKDGGDAAKEGGDAEPPPSVLAIAAETNNTCALLAGGKVSCWGQSNFGGLGTGDASVADCGASVACTTTPRAVPSLTGVTALAPGGAHFCALLPDSTVSCWGNDEDGELGAPPATSCLCASVPTHIPGVTGVTAISAGQTATCAILADTTVTCWGLLEGAADPGSPAPAPVPGLVGVTSLAVGSAFACALLSDTTVACWGLDSAGQLGIGDAGISGCPVFEGSIPCSLTPLKVPGLSGVTAIAAGAAACALLGDGSVMCWGDNRYGELGDGTLKGPELCAGAACSTTPVAVTGLAGATAIALGGSSTSACAILADGTVKCWGSNGSGELGDGKMSDATAFDGTPCATTPVSVSNLSGVTSVSVASGNACALLATGRVMCWGANFAGELGNGTTTGASVPVAVVGL
jgi:alpha-tubulin suppressor-like RCC1 family protein